jgi:long-chain acyl-CoA synthetase
LLYDLLSEQARRRPDRPAVIGEKRRLNYATFLREVDDTADYLAALGLGAGDAIMIGIPASPEFHVLFYAACALGLLILPVLPSGKIPEVVRKAKPAAAVGADSFLYEATARCEELAHRIEYGPDSKFRFPAGSRNRSSRTPFREQRILGVSSSGTTGEPSLYLRSAQQILNRADMRVSLHNLRADDVLFSTRPYNSGSAINNHVITPVFVGCAIVVQERFERLKAAEAISRERVTVLWAVPFFFEMLATIPRGRRLDFSAVRLCVSGSAALAPSVGKQFEDRYGLIIRQRYGGSQIHPAFLVNLDGPRDSVGRVDGLFPAVILDENGNELKAPNIGEIAFDVARSLPLWRKTLQANPNVKDGYLRSGDLGRADDDGNVYVVGRKSPFIKVGANRVEPAEVENVLRLHPQVSEALAFGVRVGDTHEAVQAEVAVLGQVTERELLSFCARHLDTYKCPRRIAIKTDLPRNIHGKIIRSGSKTVS